MRLIDADALKIPSEEMIAKMIINSAPSIDIVFCKECCHKDIYKGELFCRIHTDDVKADDFCSYGEREGE